MARTSRTRRDSRPLLLRLYHALFGKPPHWLSSTPRQRLGAKAERAAVRHLRGQGWRILARNIMTRRGEIDVLANDGEFLCFIEVRSLTVSDARLRPALDREKQARFCAAMDEIVKRRGWGNRKRRADLVEVYLDARGRATRVEVYKAAIRDSRRWQG